MIIKLILSVSLLALVNSAIFPGTSCLKQPAGKQWYLRDMKYAYVYYKCTNGVPVKMACYRIFCACIGSDCMLAEGEKMLCSISYKCPALTAVAKPVVCESDTCHSGKCVLTKNSNGITNASCICDDGHYGNKCEQDACHPNNCMSGDCKRLPEGRYQCDCYRGFTGKYCELDECLVKDCVKGQGYCKRFKYKEAKCKCRRGYKGKRCEIDVCAATPCQNGGYCSKRKNRYRYVCYCKRGFSGYNCDIKNNTGSCQPQSCKYRGECVDIQGGHYCNCNDGYYGKVCGKDVCLPQPCQRGGSCTRTADGYKCVCPIGLLGKTCEVDSCEPSPCRNSGTCTGIQGDFHCSCLMGYYGKVCQIDECGINRCRNGGTCLRKQNSYQCKCMGGFHGTHCEHNDETMQPYDARAYFNCQYSFDKMSNQTAGLKDVESCRTWCYIREDHISQTVRRGCWYPGLFNEDPILYAEPLNGCGFFSDNLLHTDTGNDKVYCFCKSMDGLCNAGNIGTVLKELPIIQKLV